MSEVQQSPEAGGISPELAVEIIGYLGGEYGYCEAIIIGEGTTQQFMLYNPQIGYDWQAGRDVVTNWVARFPDRESLEESFTAALQRLQTDASLPWEQTDDTLGTGMSEEAYRTARASYIASKSKLRIL